jgi:prepilin-type N-terminal cleavage/methylation domain-containing protein
MQANKKGAGFTLIELSIVLVIIGLIVGGVLVGQDLIKAAEQRKTISEAERYKTAYQAFRLKYNAIPGDMTNAVSVLGATAGHNGDGNGNIMYSTLVYGDATAEGLMFFEHLGLANLIGGRFTGIATGSQDFVIGTNVPQGAISGEAACIPVEFSVGEVFYSSLNNNNFIAFGAIGPDSALGANLCFIPTRTTREASDIDKKIDDNNPTRGSFRAGALGDILGAEVGTGCWSGTYGAADSAYTSLASTDKLCTAMFKLD